MASHCQFHTVLITALALSLSGSLNALASTTQTSDEREVSADPATVTERKGDVLKRQFQDWTRRELGNPEVVQLGDHLYEGMQVATGRNSYAQVSWPSVTTRAWANSVYCLAPNRRLVYLQSGQLLFCLDKHRKDKGEYVLFNNMLQARVRGTTVMFQSDGIKSQIGVLEGCIEVLNKRDHSVVRLTPGSIYEVIDKTALTGASHESEPEVTDKAADTAVSPTLQPITAGAPVTLFETNQTRANVYAVSAAAYQLPIVTAMSSPLPSLPLLNQTLGSLPAALLTPVENVVGSTLRLLAHTVTIIRTPIATDYIVGPLIGSAIKLPTESLTFFPPKGIASSGTPIGMVHQDSGGGMLTPVTPLTSSSASALVSPAGLVAPAALAMPAGMASTQLQTALTPGATGSMFMPGATVSAAARTLGGVGALPGGVLGTTGSVVTNTTSGLGGVLGGVTNTTNQLTNTITNTLGGIHLP